MSWLKHLDPGPRTRVLGSLYDNQDASERLLRRLGLVAGLGGGATLATLGGAALLDPEDWEQQDAFGALEALAGANVDEMAEQIPRSWTLQDALDSQGTIDRGARWALDYAQSPVRSLDMQVRRVLGG